MQLVDRADEVDLGLLLIAVGLITSASQHGAQDAEPNAVAGNTNVGLDACLDVMDGRVPLHRQRNGRGLARPREPCALTPRHGHHLTFQCDDAGRCRDKMFHEARNMARDTVPDGVMMVMSITSGLRWRWSVILSGMPLQAKDDDCR